MLEPERPSMRVVTLRRGGRAPLALSPVITEVVAETAARQGVALVVRQQDPYLLLGPQDRRLPTIESAAAWAEAEGVPVYMRIGGGSAVYLDGGCLSFGAARPCRDLTTLERNYRELAGPVIDALQALGLPAQFGAAAGSYCEGPWDIVVDGVKVAGVAQAIRGGFTLVSGMILLDQDPVEATGFVQEVYRRAGSPLQLSAAAVTSVAHLIGRRVPSDEMEQRIREAWSLRLPLYEDPLTAEELGRAEALIAERRFHS